MAIKIQPKVKDLRKAHDLSQEELAKRLGVSRQTVFLIESGRSDPSVSLACQIAHEFQTTIEELFNIGLPVNFGEGRLPLTQSVGQLSQEVSMNHLIPSPPFRELRDLREEIDRLFDESFTQMPTMMSGLQVSVPALNVHQTDKEVTIEAAVPGFKEDEIDIEVEDNLLTIRGEKKHEEEEKNKGYLRREFAYGRFERSVSLPDKVKVGQVKAELKDGTLVVVLPKVRTERAKAIKVKLAKK